MDLKITMGSCRYLISSFHLYVGKYVHTYKSSKRSRKFKISNDFQNVILRRPLKQLSPKLGAMHHLVPISHFMMSSLLKNTFDLKICTNMLLLQFVESKHHRLSTDFVVNFYNNFSFRIHLTTGNLVLVIQEILC